MPEPDDVALLARRLVEVEWLYGVEGFHQEGESPPPALYLLHRSGPPWQIPLSPGAWPRVVGGCAFTIRGMAELMPTDPDCLYQLVGPQFFGVGFADEAWAVFRVRDEDDHDPLPVGHGEVANHPDRVSIRLVAGVTRTQERAVLIRREDQPDDLIKMTAGDDWAVAGDIMAALVELVASLDHGRPD